MSDHYKDSLFPLREMMASQQAAPSAIQQPSQASRPSSSTRFFGGQTDDDRHQSNDDATTYDGGWNSQDYGDDHEPSRLGLSFDIFGLAGGNEREHSPPRSSNRPRPTPPPSPTPSEKLYAENEYDSEDTKLWKSERRNSREYRVDAEKEERKRIRNEKNAEKWKKEREKKLAEAKQKTEKAEKKAAARANNPSMMQKAKKFIFGSSTKSPKPDHPPQRRHQQHQSQQQQHPHHQPRQRQHPQHQPQQHPQHQPQQNQHPHHQPRQLQHPQHQPQQHPQHQPQQNQHPHHQPQQRQHPQHQPQRQHSPQRRPPPQRQHSPLPEPVEKACQIGHIAVRRGREKAVKENGGDKDGQIRGGKRNDGVGRDEPGARQEGPTAPLLQKQKKNAESNQEERVQQWLNPSDYHRGGDSWNEESSRDSQFARDLNPPDTPPSTGHDEVTELQHALDTQQISYDDGRSIASGGQEQQSIASQDVDDNQGNDTDEFQIINGLTSKMQENLRIVVRNDNAKAYVYDAKKRILKCQETKCPVKHEINENGEITWDETHHHLCKDKQLEEYEKEQFILKTMKEHPEYEAGDYKIQLDEKYGPGTFDAEYPDELRRKHFTQRLRRNRK